MGKLKELREERNITQEDIAIACGVSRSTIAMIEIGQNKPSLELAKKLAEVLNVSLDELLRGE